MRTTRIALLTGAAAIILAGIAGDGQGPDPANVHVLTLRLPDGRVEQIRYSGDVPPTVVLAPDAMATSFAPVSPFALLAQMSADMERQEAAMFRTIDAMAMPNGAGFGMIPVLAGPGVCTRSVQITFTGNGSGAARRIADRRRLRPCPGPGDTRDAAERARAEPRARLIEARAESPGQG